MTITRNVSVGTLSLGLLIGCSSGDGSGSNGGVSTDAAATGGSPGVPAAGGSGTGSTPSGAGGMASAGGRSGAGGSTSGTAGSEVSFDGTRIRASIIARAVPPGDEQHVCVTLELPNPDAVWVDDIHATLTGGSHHLIVDRRAAGTAAQPEPEVCFPTMGGEDSRLVIAQQTETSVVLPDGVAFPIQGRQPLFLQLHYFNSGGETRDITGTVELTLADTSGGAPVEAKSIFTGSLDLYIEAQSAGSEQSFFTPRAAAGQRHVFALTSHTHKLGVRSTIERVGSPTAAPTTPIHESLNWSEPPLTMFSPPLDFDGSDGLRLICNYQNNTSQPVSFGTGVDQEMCFMWVYYFDR